MKQIISELGLEDSHVLCWTDADGNGCYTPCANAVRAVEVLTDDLMTCSLVTRWLERFAIYAPGGEVLLSTE